MPVGTGRKIKESFIASNDEKRLTPYIDSNAALVYLLKNKEGQLYFTHNGGNEAFLCTSYGSMQGGNGVVIMINGENFWVINELLSSVAIVYGWKGFYKPTYRKTVLFQKIHCSNSSVIFFYKRYADHFFCGDNLCIQENRQAGFQMFFSDNSNFSIREVPNAFFTVIRNAAGKVEALQLKQGGANIRLPKIE
jgi:hypothetical protein